jgi:hypothetical protein
MMLMNQRSLVAVAALLLVACSAADDASEVDQGQVGGEPDAGGPGAVCGGPQRIRCDRGYVCVTLDKDRDANQSENKSPIDKDLRRKERRSITGTCERDPCIDAPETCFVPDLSGFAP